MLQRYDAPRREPWLNFARLFFGGFREGGGVRPILIIHHPSSQFRKCNNKWFICYWSK